MFNLLYPEWLWALLLVFALGVAVVFHHKTVKAVLSYKRLFLFLAALSLVIVALSRPQWGRRSSQSVGSGSNIFIAIDISMSMLAEDIRPSRLKFSKTALQTISPELSGSQLALFPFAADGYLQTPLTHDLNTIANVLNTLSPTMTTDQGTDLSRALETLFVHINKMEKESIERGEDWLPSQVILFSDGESHHQLNENIFLKYKAKRIPIFTVGTGTSSGGNIPVRFTNTFSGFRNAGFLKDAGGKVVETKLDSTSLKKISEISGGRYFSAQLSDMRRLGRTLQVNQRTTSVRTTVNVEAEYFPVLLAAAILLLFLELLSSRWEYAIRILVPFALFLVAAKAPENTPSADELKKQIEQTKSPENRSRLFHNLAVKLEEQNDIEKAAHAYLEASYLAQEAQTKKKALFNLGNALLKLQKPKEAIETYQHAYDVQTKDAEFDKETNKKLSENLTIASKILQQAQSSSQSGDGDPKKGQQPKDPKGAKKDYKEESFSKARKRRLFDMLASEEQQTLQKLQRKKNQGEPVSQQAKNW